MTNKIRTVFKATEAASVREAAAVDVLPKVNTRTVKMTGRMADDLLSRNTRNRNIREERVERYAGIMRQGKWLLNGETIIVSDQGNLMNGQHRLRAVIKSGMDVYMTLAEGVDEDAFSTMDDGLSRTASDVLGMNGLPDASSLAATMRLTLNYKDNKPVSWTRTNLEIKDAVERRPELSGFIDQHRKLLKIGRSVTMSALYIAHQFGPEDQKKLVTEFAEGVVSGANLTQYDARLIFRNKMMNFNANKKTRPEQVVVWNLVTRALSHYIKGSALARLMPGRGDPTFVEIPMAPRKLVKAQW